MPGEGRLILEAMDRAGFWSEAIDVAVDLPAMTGVYEVPPRSSGAPIARLAKAELARAHRVDPSQIEAAVCDAPRPASSRAGTQEHVLAIGLEREAVVPMLLDLDHAGLEPRRVTVPHVALLNGAMQQAGVAEAIGVLDLSWSGAHLSVGLRDDGADGWAGVTACFVRHVAEASLSKLAAASASRFGDSQETALEALGLMGLSGGFEEDDPAGLEASRRVVAAVRPCVTQYLDALCTEVGRSIAYVAHRHPWAPVTRLFVCGDGAVLSGVCDRLATDVGIEVSPLYPAAMCDVDERVATIAGNAAMTPVVAMALEASGIGVARARRA
jgi:Tfp pilus assembly PilM family ATPase